LKKTAKLTTDENLPLQEISPSTIENIASTPKKNSELEKKSVSWKNTPLVIPLSDKKKSTVTSKQQNKIKEDVKLHKSSTSSRTSVALNNTSKSRMGGASRVLQTPAKKSSTASSSRTTARRILASKNRPTWQ